MGGNGNENDSMGVGREWEQESHSRTPLVLIMELHSQFSLKQRVQLCRQAVAYSYLHKLCKNK